MPLYDEAAHSSIAIRITRHSELINISNMIINHHNASRANEAWISYRDDVRNVRLLLVMRDMYLTLHIMIVICGLVLIAYTCG